MLIEEIDKRFEIILDIAKQNELPLDIIKKAYNVAKQLHKNQTRQEGSPYISHPVEVAIILAKLNFDENVICGALLHDTIEDCGYTENQMKTDFNNIIFDLVNCVSAIDRTKYIFDKNNIYEDPEFIKSSAKEQTFKKLIVLGKNNPCGFAIKFADRLHNLSTIQIFNYTKQLEKVRETEKWVLPIAKALKSEYFYRAIKNECFKIVNRDSVKKYLQLYDVYHNINKKYVDNLHFDLTRCFAGSSIFDIKIEDVKQYKVFEDLNKIYKKLDLSKISQGQILKVANYNIFLIYKNSTRKKSVAEVFDILNKSNLKIIDAKIGGFTDKIYFLAEDEYKNKYNIYIFDEKEYATTKVGTMDGQNLDKIDEENLNNLDVDLIRVKTRSNESLYIAKNSTVLDFAFKIHKDIGFAFKYALINDSKTKFPPYTKLNEGDKVEIVADNFNDGSLKNNAQLKWLAYVNTELAKKILIKYFENLNKNDL